MPATSILEASGRMGTTMWVANNPGIYGSGSSKDRIYAYNLASKTRVTNLDIYLHSHNRDPYGIWSDGQTMWVVDDQDDKIYAYDLSNKTRKPSEDFNSLVGAPNSFGSFESSVVGLCSDGQTMWVIDTTLQNNHRLYAYNLSNKTRDPNRDINISSYNGIDGLRNRHLWTDGWSIWITYGDNLIFAYNISTQVRDPSKTIQFVSSYKITGLWSDGVSMWVADIEADHLIPYNLPARVLTP